ncbi:DUF4362 domain-containing protein [Metasolibacillus meyeri]|uniref:DUF4362 domain-containing protein n=1 Tax=Metasolibacillus meyeri TaxID=1071052 RepID=UPI000D2FDD3B|nr:DUF4362 domain-containing protein [Metasolibacillus meyeri]
MKKIILLLSIFLIAGCQNTENIYDTDSLYTALPKDVVVLHDKILNIERFESFLNHIEGGEKDDVRVVRYTTEGDPIFHELAYDTDSIKYSIDTTKDQYGSGQIIEAICTSIDVVKHTQNTEYILEGCDKDIDSTIFSHHKE